MAHCGESNRARRGGAAWRTEAPMRLLPRQEKFYTSFLSQVHLIAKASKLLLEAVQGGNLELSRAAVHIQQLEHEGDEIIHDIFTRLNQTFITPLDPEDIHSLSSRLDDVLDGIEDAAYRMVAYRLEPIPETAVELCVVVHDCAKALEKAFEKLNQDQKLLEDCIEVNRLENYADLLVRRAIAELFQQEKDPIALIKKKEILELLEDTTDRCEDVADVLQNVVVKNS
jgi:predicted phosphate transport protein (TIGR00153 family)